ncbi:peroxidase family protein [Desertibaculum subflavum]|uniref:peroxidase family protein n=1 Tax=Desertibaculum subflavum TaxID=2268458 RepID=UPI000E6720F2
MKPHGGSAPIFFRERSGPVPPASGQPAAGAAAFGADRRSFRNFLRAPTAAERFKVFGKDPAADEAATRGLLRRLARCLPDELDWPAPPRGGALPWENPGIPCGYTYLAQLVGHDLVLTSMHTPSLDRPGEAFRNLRSFSLDLDTLYGGGPVACPHAYAVTDFDDTYRTKLRLGPMRPSMDSVPAANPPYRDVGRARICGGNDFQRRGRTDALLADPRNDDNSNLSQLTTVFIHLHNAMVDRLAAGGILPAAETEMEQLEAQFAVARQIVRTVYRRIIRKDLLPRILHPKVVALYDTASPRFIDDGAGEQIPLEFSHAGYRFGHAMVRPHYQLNAAAPDTQPIDAILLTTSARQPWNTPLTELWIVQWSLFFDVAGMSPPAFSRRIGPSMAGKLEATRRPQGPSEEEIYSLAHRDLLRGAAAGMWSVRSLIAEIRQRRPELIEASDLLGNYGATRARVESWLKLYGSRVLESGDFATLAEEPPLFFFLLFEAAYGDTRGCRLGVLGSTIVAETLYQALAAHAGDYLPDAKMAEVLDRVFGGKVPETMPELLDYVADAAGLRDATPAFL